MNSAPYILCNCKCAVQYFSVCLNTVMCMVYTEHSTNHLSLDSLGSRLDSTWPAYHGLPVRLSCSWFADTDITNFQLSMLNKYGATAMMAVAIRWTAETHWPLKPPLNNIWKHIGFICEPLKHICKDIRFLDSPLNLKKYFYIFGIGKLCFFLLNCGPASLAGWNS